MTKWWQLRATDRHHFKVRDEKVSQATLDQPMGHVREIDLVSSASTEKAA